MNASRINAIVATATNVLNNEEIREKFPQGVRPADAANFARSVKVAWLMAYRDRKDDQPLYTKEEVQEAIEVVLAKGSVSGRR